ncbi:MAG: tetratricopeptide repeat protein, partial [Anaerolineae bacterium]
GLDETENRHFVDALLDAEPNQLGVAFRHTLYRSTAGQPLFTVELLHMMQERGDLRQNPQGYWVESDSLAWERLPARVEAVIGERLNRLEPELRQTLSIASMSGEEFIAQAVAIVQNLDERRWLSQLAQVERQYHLVRERGEAQAGDRILSRYQFAHTLFQRYLYESLSRAERRLLHGQVGAALERLYGDQSGEVAGQLAWHFQEAQRPGRACPYLRQAGEQAARQYANDEALAYFNRALELTPTEAQAERLTLLLAREQIYYLQGKRQAQQQDLAALQELAELLGDERQRTEVALRQAMCAAVISDHPLAITTAQTAISLAQATGDKQSEARGYRIWGTSLNQQGNYQAAQIQLNKALALAQAGRLRLVEADTLRSLSWVAYHLGDYRRATLYNEQALIIYRELGHRSGEAEALNNLGVHADQQAAYDLARAYYQQALTIQQEIGNIRGEAGTLGNLGLVCFHGGDYPAAEVHYTQALHIFSEIGDRLNEGLIRTNLGLLWHHWGDDEAARRYSQEALMIAQEVGNRNGQSFALTNLGHALTGLGHLTEAAEVYRQALAIRRELEQPNLAMETVAGLARVTLGQGNLPQSLAYIEQILNHLESHTLEGAEHPFQVYLTCYQVLLANQDARTTSFLTLAYRLLQEQAIKISDEAQRRSFLEQVTAHRELVEAFERNEF